MAYLGSFGLIWCYLGKKGRKKGELEGEMGLPEGRLQSVPDN